MALTLIRGGILGAEELMIQLGDGCWRYVFEYFTRLSVLGVDRINFRITSAQIYLESRSQFIEAIGCIHD